MLPLSVIVVLALLLPGAIVRFRSMMAGRRGKPFFQHISDVVLELRKGSVYSTTSSCITRLAAPFDLAMTLTAMLCIPIGAHGALVSFDGDIIFVLYMFSFGKIMIALSALDSSSSFGGMGASRELFYNILCEPAYMILMATLSLVTGTWSFSQLFSVFSLETSNLLVLSVLVGYGIFKLSLVELARVPVDDTRTHLELTMVHESQILEFSGADMALVRMSGWLKMAIWCVLCVNTVVPFDLPLSYELMIFIGSGVLFALVIAFVESFKARSPLRRNSVYAMSVTAIGLLAFTVGYIIVSSVVVS